MARQKDEVQGLNGQWIRPINFGSPVQFGFGQIFHHPLETPISFPTQFPFGFGRISAETGFHLRRSVRGIGLNELAIFQIRRAKNAFRKIEDRAVGS